MCSVVLGRPAVNFLQQEEVKREGEQRQRARIDSDHRSAHIPLQGEKKKTRFQPFQLIQLQVLSYIYAVFTL